MKDKCCENHIRGNSINIINEKEVQSMEKFLKVMADRTRLKILYALLSGKKCVCEIQELTNCSQSLISHQLKKLRENRLVKTEREGNKIIYSLIDDHIYSILSVTYDHIITEHKEEE